MFLPILSSGNAFEGAILKKSKRSDEQEIDCRSKNIFIFKLQFNDHFMSVLKKIIHNLAIILYRYLKKFS